MFWFVQCPGKIDVFLRNSPAVTNSHASTFLLWDWLSRPLLHFSHIYLPGVLIALPVCNGRRLQNNWLDWSIQEVCLCSNHLWVNWVDDIRQMALVGGSSQTGKWTYEPSVESRPGPHKQTCSSRTVPPWRKSSSQLSQDGSDCIGNTEHFGSGPSK